MTQIGGTAVETSAAFDAFNYRPDAGWSADHELIGYHAEAADGHVGKIEEASYALDASYLVVTTGPWIFGHKVMIPAGTVNHIDHDDRKVYLDLTKEQVKSAPDFDADAYTEPEYRLKVGDYYNHAHHTR
jgi:hypothetical protein